ncbi:MAG: hypothetical protein J6A75_06815 [Lachnospiraceae bacterium]|nr:hypothetical protein [Lachnospiraceae bacterium]
MVKMNFTNDQVAFEYALYMMVGSRFQRTTCKNHLLERKMRLQYMEQKANNQYQMEDICLAYMKKHLLPHLPKEFWQEKMSVHFHVSSKQGMTEIYFYNRKYLLCLKGKYAGKNSWMYHEIWKK